MKHIRIPNNGKKYAMVAIGVMDFPADMASTYAFVVALLCGIILAAALNFKHLKTILGAINAGANGSVSAIMNTSAVVGFGAVVKGVPGFATLTEMVLGIKASPLISEALSVTLLAGATGSSSGGMGIALEALGAQYMTLAAQLGIHPGALHRVASIASGGLDSLPHCGAVITLLAVTGMNHKKSYADITVTACAEIVGVNRNTVNSWYNEFRHKILLAAIAETRAEGGEFEVDESYFGACRVRGKRGRGAAYDGLIVNGYDHYRVFQCVAGATQPQRVC